MRWILPAALVAVGLGVLLLYMPTMYVPAGKGAALILPPQAPLALILVGMAGIVVGVIGTWRSRPRPVVGVPGSGSIQLRVATKRRGGRAANAAALAGLVLAVAALLAVSLVWIGEPILASVLQGSDPCGPATFLPNHQPDTVCFAAHPDYYHYDPSADSYSTPASRLFQSLTRVGLAALPLGLGAALISWLALMKGTGRRRTALSALTLGSLLVVGMIVLYFGFLLQGGD